MDPSRRPYHEEDPIRIDTLGHGSRAGGEAGASGPRDWKEIRYDSQTGVQKDHGTGPPETVLTPEDIRLLRECNRESFYRRCLPLVIAGNFLTQTWYSRAAEPLSRNKRYGAHFFVTVAMWITGKLSYRKVCEDKIITSGYSSKLVDSIRKRRGIATSDSDSPGDYYGDDSQSHAFDWKEDDRQSVMKDDRNRLSDYPVGDGPIGDKPFYGDDEMSSNSRKEYTSYDVLRERNRARAVPLDVTRPQTPSSPRSYEDRKF